MTNVCGGAGFVIGVGAVAAVDGMVGVKENV